jgi:uncharacterized protein
MRQAPLSALLLSLLFATPASGQVSSDFIGDARGTGTGPALIEARAELPMHTLYRPFALPTAPMPLLVWGNGGCSDNGQAHAAFLREIASHGYLVVSLGRARVERREGPPPAPQPGAAPAVDATSVEQMLEAMDWAAKVNQTNTDPLFGRIDLNRIAVAGHSCGGLQALKISADPRIDTSMIFNSGIYIRPGGRSGVAIDKNALNDLHGPVAYFTGGAEDVAHANTVDDVARIDHVPVFFGWMPVGHGGTFSAENGGDWAKVAVQWLNWQFRDDASAASWFRGEDCYLCQQESWTVERVVGR